MSLFCNSSCLAERSIIDKPGSKICFSNEKLLNLASRHSLTQVRPSQTRILAISLPFKNISSHDALIMRKMFFGGSSKCLPWQHKFVCVCTRQISMFIKSAIQSHVFGMLQDIAAGMQDITVCMPDSYLGGIHHR